MLQEPRRVNFHLLQGDKVGQWEGWRKRQPLCRRRGLARSDLLTRRYRDETGEPGALVERSEESRGRVGGLVFFLVTGIGAGIWMPITNWR